MGWTYDTALAGIQAAGYTHTGLLTGNDPLEQLKPIAQHVTGFCAKDCDQQKGSVWLEFGKGTVDFPAVFGELQRAGFNGPVMVECCAQGDTPEAVTAGARKNREYLAKLFATL